VFSLGNSSDTFLLLRAHDAGLSTALVVLATTAAVAGPWYVRQTIRYSNPVAFNRSAPDVPIWRRRPASFYFGVGLPEVVRTPRDPSS
jgi:hypothetical protein